MNLTSNNENDVNSEVSEHERKELEQEKIILEETNKILERENQQISYDADKLKKECVNDNQKINELEQEKIILEEIITNEEKHSLFLHKKFYIIISIIAILGSIGFIAYSFYENQIILNSTSALLTNYNSNYVIQNLRGDVVNTWVEWNISPDRILHIDIVNTANLPQDKIDAVKNAILSTKTINIDDSLLNKGPKGTSSVYYEGWEGALSQAYTPPTTSYVPQKFDISGSPSGMGDIVIVLTNDVNPDGLSGLTKSIADGNQILKSKITIYRASQLSANQLEAITRHEFGHAMGLAHSSATEDLMHATIQTEYPYISECDVDAIKKLYDGGKKSEVICQK